LLEENTSLEAAPKELREAYEKALVAGNKEQIEELLTELWEEYGIDGEDAPERETSGIKRIAVMCDHGVNAFGFKGKTKQLLEWMLRNGFDPDDTHHFNLSMYD
jgi:hypothetical protein